MHESGKTGMYQKRKDWKEKREKWMRKSYTWIVRPESVEI